MTAEIVDLRRERARRYLEGRGPCPGLAVAPENRIEIPAWLRVGCDVRLKGTGRRGVVMGHSIRFPAGLPAIVVLIFTGFAFVYAFPEGLEPLAEDPVA